MKQLQRKRIPWKKQMLTALEAARTKLDVYYAQTDHIRGHVFAISTMLAPVNKFKFFLTKDWEKKWRDTYRKAFADALVPYQDRLIDARVLQCSQALARKRSKLSDMLDQDEDQPTTPSDELTQYLDSSRYTTSLS
jgi:hypothetical protein